MTNVTESKASRPPRIGAAQIRLLERLSNACSVSGDESEVRAIVLEQIRPLANQLKIDAMGNVLAVRSGQGKPKLRLMLAAHMDEVGLMLTYDDGEGIFRFEAVGGLTANQLAGKPVWIGRDHVPGVIGTKAVHLIPAEERKANLAIENLRIDVSPDNAKRVKPGDRATFATAFTRQGPSLRGKALDDRLGVATLIELFKSSPPEVELLAAFTVQEESGLRGARVAAYALNPDLAIILDCTPARDLPDWESGGLYDEEVRENVQYNTRLGAGPAIYVADASTLSDPRLVRHFLQTAEAAGIPCQVRQPGGGGTDAGSIHLQRAGIPSISISVPARYIHTAAAIARLEDWKNDLALVYSAIASLTPDLLSVER